MTIKASILDRLRRKIDENIRKGLDRGAMHSPLEWEYYHIYGENSPQYQRLIESQKETNRFHKNFPNAVYNNSLRQKQVEAITLSNRLSPEYRKKFKQSEENMRNMYPWDSRGNAVDSKNIPATKYYSEVLPAHVDLLSRMGDEPPIDPVYNPQEYGDVQERLERILDEINYMKSEFKKK